MKGKKLLSMLTAGALAVTMVMPAMAAPDGTVDVELTTKTGVIRVQVPTTLAVAVDQFELGAAGTQIASADFTMVNKSEMDVKVKVDSTAAVPSATVKETVAEVEAAEDGDAFVWLGAAAMTAKDTYFAARGSFADLDDTSANVATFDSTNKKATQEFYLAKATGNKTYKVLKTATAGEANVSYAQFYKLTDVSSGVTDQDTLDAKIAASDVYVTSEATVADGTALTLVEKGGSYTWASGLKVYTAEAAPTAVGSLTTSDQYVYGEMGTDGGAAGFRYIGKLSNTQESWTKDDITDITIEYTITAISPDSYNANKTLCTYGLYKEPVATYSEISNVSWVSLDGSKGFAAAPTSVKVGATTLNKGTGAGTYSFEKSGWIKLNEKPAAGATIEVVVNGIKFTATVPAATP